VALRQHVGPACTPCVEVGQSVRGGQVIGRADEATGGEPVHAPTSGRVAGFVTVETPHACDVPAVEIEPDGLDAWETPSVTPTNEISLPALIDLLDRAGVAGISADGSTPAATLAAAAGRDVRALIINGVESEPMLTAEYRILTEHGQRILQTADLLATLLGVHRPILAVDRADKYLADRLRRWAHGTHVRVSPLASKYPQSATPLLVRSIVKREIPYGRSALDVGAVVFDVATTWAIGRAVYEGRPVTRRIVTVAGKAVSRPGNYDVPLGTPLRRLIEHVGLRNHIRRAVIGGPMTGVTVSSMGVVTTKRVGAVLLLTDEQVVVRRPGPCVRCGWCLEDCPVGLDPPECLAAVESKPNDPQSDKDGRLERIAHLFPHACLGCGICSYVCPAGLSLTEGVARARALVPI